MIEVGQDVPGSAFECPAQRNELSQTPRYTRAGQCINFGLHHGHARTRIGRTVDARSCSDSAPRDLKDDVLLAGKQVDYLALLTRREHAGSGVQHPAGLVQRGRSRPRRW